MSHLSLALIVQHRLASTVNNPININLEHIIVIQIHKMQQNRHEIQILFDL